MAAFRNSNLWTWADGYWLLTRQPGTKWHLPLQNDQGWHTKMKRKTNYIVRKERNIKRSMLRKKPLEMCSIAWLSVVGKVKRQHDITTEKTERPLSKSIQTRKSRAMFVKGTLCQVWRVPFGPDTKYSSIKEKYEGICERKREYDWHPVLDYLLCLW